MYQIKSIARIRSDKGKKNTETETAREGEKMQKQRTKKGQFSGKVHGNQHLLSKSLALASF